MTLVILVVLFLIVNFLSKGKKKNEVKQIEKISHEDNLLAIDELRKILKGSPGNHKVREKLADMLMDIKSYVLAVKELLLLIDHCSTNPELNELKLTIKIGIAFFHLDNIEEAKKYFLMAKKLDDLNFDVNLYLGKIEMKRNNFEKALFYLNISINVNPEDPEIQKSAGICYYHVNKYNNSVELLLKYFQKNPDDVEAIYHLAYGLFYMSRLDDSLKFFTRLQDVKEYAVESLAMMAGIHKKQKMYNKSIEEYEKVIASKVLKNDQLIEILYLTADCHVNNHEIPKAINYWQKISNVNPNYKNVKENLATYTQINSNTMLEKYLIGSVNQFTNICKIFIKFYVAKFSKLKGTIKFNNIQMNNDNTLEIYTEISSRNFVELIYFNFMRSSTTVGDLIVRNIYNKLREQKIDRGICVTAGNFSDTAKMFVESRMIELVEKKQLEDILMEISNMLKDEQA
jgi:tetratricopeptide (TPR) repeat protein